MRDYKKNGIEKNVNTLGNASINNDGAVQNHEWLLIIGLTTLFFYYRKQKNVELMYNLLTEYKIGIWIFCNLLSLCNKL
jgi:hypothetical protein